MSINTKILLFLQSFQQTSGLNFNKVRTDYLLRNSAFNFCLNNYPVLGRYLQGKFPRKATWVLYAKVMLKKIKFLSKEEHYYDFSLSYTYMQLVPALLIMPLCLIFTIKNYSLQSTSSDLPLKSCNSVP